MARAEIEKVTEKVRLSQEQHSAALALGEGRIVYSLRFEGEIRMGTQFGVYSYKWDGEQWIKVHTPTRKFKTEEEFKGELMEEFE